MTERRTASIGGWLPIGVGVGVALGVALNNLALWIPVGLVLGRAIGSAGSTRRGRDPRCR